MISDRVGSVAMMNVDPLLALTVVPLPGGADPRRG